MNLKLLPVLAAGLLIATPALAGPVTLTFEGAGPFNFINQFYAGGTNDGGASGTNYGISFGPGALAFSNDPAFPNYSNAPTNGTIMSATDADSALNVAGGFLGAASFYYSSASAGSVGIYDGLNGTGNLLGSFSLSANAQDGCSDTSFCSWQFVSVSFNGLARSIQFGSVTGAGFDNVALNVPEPSLSMLLLAGLGGIGAAVRRKAAR